MLALLATFSWQELRHHPWRNAAAVVAVMLGVALAFSVHLINASALDEFSSAVRAVNGQPDLELRAVQGGFDEALYARVAQHPSVRLASPVLELQALAVDAQGQRRALRVLGVDALVAATLAPALTPQPAQDADRFALFAPGQVFVNALARSQFVAGGTLRVQTALTLRPLQVAGSVGAAGAPMAVMDIGAAQDFFGRVGELTRIDVQLVPGTDRAAFGRSLALPAGVVVAEPGDAAQRVSNLSRAYRVNLTVLALVALFTGGFLVFSVLSLGVAKRQQQFALLGVLGLSGRARLGLVLAESLVLGAAGSAAGLVLGTALAALALRLLGGDLGGGYFPGVAPSLSFSWPAAAVFGALGVVAALLGGWMPSRDAAALAPAQALKGLGGTRRRAASPWRAAALLAAGGLLALLPPIAGLPLAAYASVAALLLGGIAAVPVVVGALLARLRPRHSALALLAVQRARHERDTATVAVAGVVASLSLAVALTVMVASFRDGVAGWLDTVLPADLYARSAATSTTADQAFLPPDFVAAAAGVPGVARVQALRVRALTLAPERPSVSLVARPLDAPARQLPMVEPPRPPVAGEVGVYVSEAMVSLYGAAPGGALVLPIGPGGSTTVRVLGVWRDYARQFGAVAIDGADYRRLTGDDRVNDLALWLAPDAAVADVQAALRTRAGDASLIEFAVPAQIRAASLAIFDRSFAVTRYLQALAIGIGLFGIAASFSAQVLARRREFGLLAHLGLTRAQVVGVVAGEGAAWTAAGTLVGLALGLLVSVVLVHVVNPQSFHWTMSLVLPVGKLALLAAAVLAAGSLTAALSARAAVSVDAVRAVREDW